MLNSYGNAAMPPVFKQQGALLFQDQSLRCISMGVKHFFLFFFTSFSGKQLFANFIIKKCTICGQCCTKSYLRTLLSLQRTFRRRDSARVSWNTRQKRKRTDSRLRLHATYTVRVLSAVQNKTKNKFRKGNLVFRGLALINTPKITKAKAKARFRAS